MAAKTMNDLWDAYEARNVRHLKTAKEVARYWTAYLQPALGDRQLVKVNYAMLDFLHQQRKSTPYQANRCLSLLRSMFRYAQAIELLPYGHNPAKFVKLHREPKRRRHMTVAEAPRIANELILREEINPQNCSLIWLAIFTGARSSELRRATWADLENNVLTLKRHKTDKTGICRTIVLPSWAVEKLNKLWPVENRTPSGRICPVSSCANLQTWWTKLRTTAGCPDLRMHDLRHTFATYALEQGFTLDQIGQCLEHANVQTTKIYAEMTNRNRHKVAAHSSLAILHDMKIIELEHHQLKGLVGW